MAQTAADIYVKCASKTSYWSRGIANRQKRRHIRWDDCRRCADGRRIDVYPCGLCDMYHLGHPSR